MYAIVIYGFPLTLLVFEWGLRMGLEVDSQGFTGPTLAAAGLSFLMPLIKPKKINLDGHPNVIATSKGDAMLMPFIWLFCLIFLFAWSAACYVSIKMPEFEVLNFQLHLIIGVAVYTISLILTGIKEKV